MQSEEEDQEQRLPSNNRIESRCFYSKGSRGGGKAEQEQDSGPGPGPGLEAGVGEQPRRRTAHVCGFGTQQRSYLGTREWVKVDHHHHHHHHQLKPPSERASERIEPKSGEVKRGEKKGFPLGQAG